MPRNYKVDHTTEQQHPPGHDTPEQAKQKVHSTEHAGAVVVESTSPIHYGHKFAQTQEILHKRALEHQQHQEHEGAEHKTPAAVPVAESKPETRRDASTPVEPAGRTPASKSAHSNKDPSLSSLWAEAQRSVEQVIHAVREVRSAGLQLARLPILASRVVLHDLEGRLGFRSN